MRANTRAWATNIRETRTYVTYVKCQRLISSVIVDSTQVLHHTTHNTVGGGGGQSLAARGNGPATSLHAPSTHALASASVPQKPAWAATLTSAVATGAQVAGRCAGAQVVGATAPPSRLARRTGPRRLRRELRRGLQRGLRRGLRRPLRRCNRGGACGQTRKGRVDGGLRAMRRRMIRPSCEFTVRAGGGRSGPSERKTRPKPASGVDGQSTAPHSYRHGGGQAPPIATGVPARGPS